MNLNMVDNAGGVPKTTISQENVEKDFVLEDRLGKQTENFLARSVTMDESLMHHYNVETKMYRVGTLRLSANRQIQDLTTGREGRDFSEISIESGLDY